ncbi:alpha,alpha-trehalase TreF [Robbsia sp. Bb-Pol-6]|uniref:Alpha,alpha-trehalase TreF n=1 Tax=Robbsia betulipollinis TaxID=2981849 RepID=A0ABT3ZS27_9BURK|nr:alpha,alpha-trehalase TreF [Robbsia betulipollinis]MCY0389364.1 alpha,alpha-trehalase TreF [Robbsia betulipollinis]
MTHTSDEALSKGGKAPGVEHVAPADVLTPADRYQELFVAVQGGRVFGDSKTFVDCIPLRDPAEILERYRAGKDQADFDLKTFVADHFVHEQVVHSHYVSDPNQTMVAHIDGLWPVLTRDPSQHPKQGSLLPLPYEYVVPGGRFGEMYYWDSYFTMLGLAESDRPHLLRAMADNFAFLIDTYGHVPNGNRSYYLSRSQPPVFALMIDFFEQQGIEHALRYLPQLKREHAFWMDGAETIHPGGACRHVVRLPDGAYLNRYWDDRDTPREEGYLEDVETARRSSRPAGDVYRDLRAGAASGWDFSSRWLGDPNDLSTIRTTAILPVDLNSFLYKLETQIERLSDAGGDTATAALFRQKAAARQAAVDRYLWSEALGAYVDFDFGTNEQARIVTAATATPLYVAMANPQQAQRVADALASRLLAAGGLMTTEQASPQQWDRANGWAPLQWIAITGLWRYGQQALSRDIAHRWLDTVSAVYGRESKLVEKYALDTGNASAVTGGGGGEYPLQDGFGWTNGVTRKLLHDHPTHRAHQQRAGKDAPVS